MTPDADAFLRAILAAPDDDLPRLVYADWLDERGDPRGEFVRLQIEAERLSAAERARHPAVGRALHLLERHRAAWEGDLSDYCRRWEFHRGFVESVVVSAGAFLSRGAALFGRHPVRAAALFDVWEDAHALGESPLLSRLTGLDLSDNRLRTHEALAVLESPHLGRLERLDLSVNRFDHRAVEAVAQSPAYAALRELDLSFCNVGSAGVIALARSPHLNELHTLRLTKAQVGPNGVDALIARIGLPRLETLVLDSNPLGGRGLRALSARPIPGVAKFAFAPEFG